MNTYKVELKVDMEINAFNEEDAKDYVSDVFGVDEEIKNVYITKIKEK
jgi:hypothetical protein